MSETKICMGVICSVVNKYNVICSFNKFYLITKVTAALFLLLIWCAIFGGGLTIVLMLGFVFYGFYPFIKYSNRPLVEVFMNDLTETQMEMLAAQLKSLARSLNKNDLLDFTQFLETSPAIQEVVLDMAVKLAKSELGIDISRPPMFSFQQNILKEFINQKQS